MTSYLPDLTALTDTISDLGTLMSSMGTSLVPGLLGLIIPLAFAGAVIGIIYLIAKIPKDVIGKAIGKL